MLVKNIISSNETSISFEFFPPKTEKGWTLLYKTISDLLPLKPAYVSVTYGAGGSTRGRTHDLIMKIKADSGLDVVAHLTCVNSSRSEIGEILDNYATEGIMNILALKGDPPSDKPYDAASQDFHYAMDLVREIKNRQPGMGVAVAGFPEGHPQTPNRLKEIDYLKAKVDAGADYIVTQLFFDNRDFYDFRERCLLAGITVPIIAGIMPVTSLKTMGRMAELSPGTRFPASLLKAIERAGDDDRSVENAGIQYASEQVRDLLDNHTSGIHFYTLNSSQATLKICQNLGIRDFSQV